MMESDNESEISSEENQDVDKVINNARVPVDSTHEEESGESSQEETEVGTKVMEQEITKIVENKKPMYRDIILACFRQYPNEKVSLKRIKSYAHTEHNITDSQEKFLNLAMKKLINEEVIQNHKGKGLSGSFKLVPQKPGKVKKITKPKTDVIGGKISSSIITAEVYGSSTKVVKPKEIPKSKANEKTTIKVMPKKKEKTEEKVEPTKKKEKAGPKKETVAKKPKEAPKGEASKKVIKEDSEDVPKKKKKLDPKKIAVPKEKPEVAAKIKTVAKKVPAKSTVAAIRKSLDNEKKKVAVSRTKKKG